MSFLDLEKNGTNNVGENDGQHSAIRIDSLNELVGFLASCIPELNRGVKHVVGNKKRDNLKFRESIEHTISETNEKINQYELTTGFQPMGKNFINKVERDLSGLILEFELLKGQYFKRKLMFPIYMSENKSLDNNDAEDRGLLSADRENDSYGSFNKTKGENGGPAVSPQNNGDMYFSIPNSERVTHEQSRVSNDTDNDQFFQQQQLQQQLQLEEQIDQQLLDEHDLVVSQQEEQIGVIHDQVTEVNLIFKQLGSLVQQQNTQVDSIENNINSFNDNIHNASKKLVQAEKSQRTRNRCGIIFLVTISMFLFILFIAII